MPRGFLDSVHQPLFIARHEVQGGAPVDLREERRAVELELSWKVLERSLTQGAFWPFDWTVRARTEDFSPGHQSGRDLWGLSLGGVPGVRALAGGGSTFQEALPLPSEATWSGQNSRSPCTPLSEGAAKSLCGLSEGGTGK